MTAMSEVQQADPEVVEELIGHMMHGLKGAGPFSPSDGISAALTMAMRMCHVIVDLSVGVEAKRANAEHAAVVLRTMAAELEMRVLNVEKVH
jgi:hypothetical protein